MDQAILLELEKALVRLYTDTYSIHRIVDSSGIDIARINFNSNVQNIWHAVLTEADNVGLLDDLLVVINGEYGNNRYFKAAYAAYRGAIEEENVVGIEPVGLTYQQLVAQGLLDELAACFNNETDANLLLESINFPAGDRPHYRQAETPKAFWSTVCRQIGQGLVPGGFEPLLAAAAARLPGNRKFAPYARPK